MMQHKGLKMLAIATFVDFLSKVDGKSTLSDEPKTENNWKSRGRKRNINRL